MACHGPFYYFCIILNMVLNRSLEAFYYSYLHHCAYSYVCVCISVCVRVSVHVVHKEGCAFPCQDCVKGLQHLGLEILIREDLKFKEKKIIFHNMPLIKIRSNSLKNNSVNKKLPNSYLVKLTFLSMLLLLTALMDLMNVDFV